MKKKYIIIAVMLVAAVCTFCIPQRNAYAAVDEYAAVSLSAPQAICAIGDNLFIADAVEEESEQFTLLHWIFADGSQSMFAEKEISGKVKAIQATATTLFLLTDSKIYSYDYTAENPSLKTYSASDLVDAEQRNNFQLLKFAASGDYLYYYYSLQSDYFVGALDLTTQEVSLVQPLYFSSPIRFLIASPDTQDKAVAYFDNAEQTKYFVLKIAEVSNGQQLQKTVDEENTIPSTMSSPLPQETIGAFNFGNKTYFYSQSTWYAAKQGDTAEDYSCWESGFLTKQIAASESEMFVLCDYQQETVGVDANPYFQKPRVAKVNFGQTLPSTDIQLTDVEYGACEIKLDIPQYSAQNTKIASVIGYPSNILYVPTKLDSTLTSVDENSKLSLDDKILILAESENKEYLFVCLGGKFGWIKNSSKVIVDTAATSLSINAVTLLPANVFSLPFDGEEFETTSQLPKLTAVTILAKTNGYALVSFNSANTLLYGFVKETTLGSNREKEVYTTYERFAANPPAGSTLQIFATEQTDSVENNQLLDENGTPISVKSGEEIRLYTTLEDGTCFIGVLVDGVLMKGYIKSADLLKTYNKGLTNAQVLAIALFAIVVIVVVFIIVIRVRTKRKLLEEKEETSTQTLQQIETMTPTQNDETKTD